MLKSNTSRSGHFHRCSSGLVTAAVIVLLAGVGWSTPGAALSLSGFKNRMIEFLLEKVSVPGQFELVADLVEDNTDGGTTLHGVQISDAEGVWFEAERFVLKWRAARLLRGEVHIDELGIHGGRLARTPVVPEVEPPKQPDEADASSGGWPRSPITARVDKLEIRDMRISDAILPQAIAFDANGGMQDEGDTQSLNLSVKRADRVRGSIKISYLKRFDTDELKLHLDAAEGPGGMVAAAAGLPPDAPTELVLRGGGTPANWKGNLTLALAQMLNAKGEVVAHWQDRIGINLAVDVVPGERLSPPVRAAIGELAELDLDVDQGEDDLVRIVKAHLQSDSVDAQASGTYDRKTTLVDMALELEAKEDGAKRLSAALTPVGFELGKFEVAVKGPASAPMVTGSSRLDGPRYDGFGALGASLEFRLPVADGEIVRVDLVAEQPYGPTSDYAAALGDTVALGMEFSRSGELVDQLKAELRAQHVAAEVSGRVELGDVVSPELEYALRVPDLGPFARIGGVDVAGGAVAKGTLSGKVGDLVTSGDLKFEKLVVRDQNLGDLAIEHSTALADIISGQVTLGMQSPAYGKGSVKTKYELSEAVLRLTELAADLLDLKADGELVLPLQATDAFDAQGEVAIVVQSLVPTGKLLGHQMSGAGEAKLLLSPDAGGTATLNANLSNFKLDTTPLANAPVDDIAKEDATKEDGAKEDGAKPLSAAPAPIAFELAKLEVVVTGLESAPVVTGTSRLDGPRYDGFGARGASLEFRLPVADGEIVRVDLVAEQPYGPTSDYAAALGDTVALGMEFSRAGELVDQLEAELRAQHVAAEVSGRVELGDVVSPELEYALRVPDLGPFARIGGVDVAGGAVAKGTLSGKVGDLVTSGDLKFEKLVVRDQNLGDLAIEHSTALADIISGQVTLGMQSPAYGKGSVKTKYELSEAVLRLTELAADLFGLKANGELALPLQATEAFGADGEVAIVVQSLVPTGKLLGHQMSGAGKAKLLLSPDAGGTATLNANLSNFKFDTTSLANAQVDANMTGLGQQFVADAKLRGTGLTAPGLVLQTFEARAKGPMTKLDFDAVLTGTRLEQALSASLAGTSDWSKQPQTVRLDRLELTVAEEAITLARAATVRIGADRTEIVDLDLRFPDDGALSGSAVVEARSAALDLILKALPLRLGHAWFGAPPVTGTLDASVKGKTGGKSPGLAATVNVNSLGLPPEIAKGVRQSRARSAKNELPELSASLAASWDGRQLSGTAEVSAARVEQPFELRFAIPLVPGKGPVPIVVETGPIEGAMKWDGSIAPIFALAPLPDDSLKGQLAVALDVGGTMSQPKVDGGITLTDGLYENLIAGTQLRNLGIDAKFNEGGEFQATVKADDGAKGTLSVEARTVLAQAPEKLDVDVTVSEFLVVRLDAATAVISSEIEAKGQPGGLKVSGKTTVERAEIRLLNPFPPSAVDLGPISMDGDTSEADAVEEEAEPSNIELDLRVSMPGNAFVRGRGLTSEWTGDLKITGTSSTPTIEGSINSKRGVFSLLGKVFTLAKGDIGFERGGDIDPRVDIQLVRATDDITGIIAVSGRASSPEVKFTSKPGLPQEEVLPRVLFGRSKQALSGAEALQLAAGIATLTRGEAGVLDNTRESLGVDVLRLDSSDEDDKDSLGSLSVGKYVAEDVFVGARQPVGGKSSTSIFIEYHIFTRTILDAEFAADETKGGVRWRRNF